jgi:hypothetical protein
VILDEPEVVALTDEKERRFVVEFAADWNQTKAAIRAGYSEDSASDIGHELSRKPKIQKAVRALQRKRAESLELDVEWAVLQFVDCYAQARDMGNLKDAIKALVNITKILGGYEKDNRQKGGTSGLDEIKAKLLARGVNVDQWAARSKN